MKDNQLLRLLRSDPNAGMAQLIDLYAGLVYSVIRGRLAGSVCVSSGIIIRKYYLGETSKEIASALGLSVSNVDTRAHRALKRLRTRLGGYEK